MKNGSPAEALDRILKSARQALVYVEDLDIQSFLADLRTMEAVANMLPLNACMSS